MTRSRAVPACLGVLLSFLSAAAARAGFDTSHLVPAYAPCSPGTTSCPAVLESRFAFERAVLKAANRRWLQDGKVALVVELRGVRDESGALVQGDPSDPGDDFVLVLPGTQVSVLGTTYAPGVLAGETRIPIEITNGKGRASFRPPAGGESSGVVAEAGAPPYVLDPDGNRLAVAGTRAKPTP